VPLVDVVSGAADARSARAPFRQGTTVLGVFYGLLGKFTAQPGQRDELVGHLLQAAALLAANPGCVSYVVSTSDEPDAVWVSEVWVDKAAHESSLEPEDIRALIQLARPLIAGMSDRTELQVHGGKGVSL